jgi:hypothetical protein
VQRRKKYIDWYSKIFTWINEVQVFINFIIYTRPVLENKVSKSTTFLSGACYINFSFVTKAYIIIVLGWMP